MLKVLVSSLAAVALFATLGISAADAKTKKVKAKKAEVASCTMSPIMRDESRFSNCWPMKKK